jgi:hypothetical protein
MADPSTDAGIAALLAIGKTVTNPLARDRAKFQHVEREYEVVGNDATKFALYTRQSTMARDNFSCGLRWLGPGGESVTLVRYNGPAHPHRNAIEGNRFVNQCHIHRATARYIARQDGQDEGYAEVTDRYTDLKGALRCLLLDCKISGLGSDEPEQMEML